MKHCVQKTRTRTDANGVVVSEFAWLQERPVFPDDGDIAFNWTRDRSKAFDFLCASSATPNDATTWGAADWAPYAGGSYVAMGGDGPTVTIGETEAELEAARIAKRQQRQDARREAARIEAERLASIAAAEEAARLAAEEAARLEAERLAAEEEVQP